MTLKSQLRVSIVTMVTMAVVAQSIASLRFAAEDKFRDALERAQAIAEQVRHLVVQRVNEQARAAAPAPTTLGELKELMQKLVENDPALPDLLLKTGANASAVVEIMVCDDVGIILASSLPQRQRLTYQSLPDLNEWQKRPLWDRIMEVLIQSQSRDYAIVTPIGLQGGALPQPILNIRVVVSTVLIRTAILPHVQTLAAVSLLSLLGSILLAYLFSNVVLRSLDRLSRRIESIATGQYTTRPPAPAKEAKEFADMQSKLDVLSQQFRGAREDMVHLRNNIERMVERLEESVLLFSPDLQLVSANRSVERLLGTDPTEMTGRALEDLFPPATPLGGLLDESIRNRHPVSDAQILLDRGEAGPIRLLVNVEFLESSPGEARPGVMVTFRDAETRRQLRSQLDISTRLAAISRLTGGVAHEIKNPLNAMALHLEILRSKLGAEEHVEQELRVIGGEIARLDRVVKTFLDFTRPVDLRLRNVNLADMTRQIMTLVRPDAERAQVDLDVDLAENVPPIRGDDDLLKQALLNVINNGIEAMKNGGRLAVQVAREGEEVVVSIADQGVGIPAEVCDKIFNLYFTTKQKGSGIGLAMTFRIVQLHNATIDFNSRPGEGTTFRLRFPAAEATSEPSNGKPVEDFSEAGAGKR